MNIVMNGAVDVPVAVTQIDAFFDGEREHSVVLGRISSLVVVRHAQMIVTALIPTTTNDSNHIINQNQPREIDPSN